MTRRRIASACAAALGVALLTPGATLAVEEPAGSPPTVVAVCVAENASGRPAAARLQAALDASLDDLPTVSARSLGSTLGAVSEPGPEVAGAQAAAEQARVAYQAMDLDLAIARASQAASLYRDGGLGDSELAGLVSALDILASALALRGSADEAEATFLELLTIRPDAPLEEAPPPVRKAFRNALAQLQDLPLASVELFTTPSVARVFIDGRFRGVTPLVLDSLVAGTHHARFELAGYRPHHARFEVGPGAPTTVQVRLEDADGGRELRSAIRKAQAQMHRPGLPAAVAELGSLLAVDRLVLASATQSHSTVTFDAVAFDLSHGVRVGAESRVLRLDRSDTAAQFDRLVARILALLEADDASPEWVTRPSGGLLEASPPPPSLRGHGPTPHVVVGWSLIGLGAAAIGTGIGFGVAAANTHSTLQDTPQNSPEVSQLQDDGQLQSALSDGLWISGAVAVAAGAIVLLLAPKGGPRPPDVLSMQQPPEPAP